MRVGILSDTHGDADIAHRAVRLLLAQGAGYLIHCGDVGETDVLDALAGVPSAFVFGNTDFDRTDLANYAQSIGVTCAFVEYPWDALTGLLHVGTKQGEQPVDVIWSALPPNASYREVAYSETYTYLPFVLARRVGDTRIRKLDDLDGKVQVAGQPQHHLQLLPVLLAEIAPVGQRHAEQLGHHRRHAIEMARAIRTLFDRHRADRRSFRRGVRPGGRNRCTHARQHDRGDADARKKRTHDDPSRFVWKIHC